MVGEMDFLRQLKLLNGLSVVLGSPAADDKISRTLQMTGEFLGLSRVMLLQYQQQSLQCCYEWYDRLSELPAQYGQSWQLAEALGLAVEALVKRDTTYYIPDQATREQFSACYGLEEDSCLFLPVFCGEDVWGLLEFGQSSSRSWSTGEIGLGQAVAALLSVTIGSYSREEQLLCSLIEAKEIAEQASQAKANFLSRMSHEMLTPMNAIIGMTDIALNSQDAHKREYCLKKIDENSKQLLSILNDILDITKIESKKLELFLAEFDFEQSLMRAADMVNLLAEEKKQELIINIDPHTPRMLIGDEPRLSQVITNLLSNAIKFTPLGGVIKLTARQIAADGDLLTLQVEVEDNGIGISAEQQERIFASFEQMDGSMARKYSGTGLGLAISKHIVNLMGGEIWVRSAPHQGSTFTFTMQVRQGEKQSEHGILNQVGRKDIHILAVDDSVMIRDYFHRLMVALELRCDVAGSGEEALQMIAERPADPYNVFFVDQQMPGMDGIELSKKIRSIAGNRAAILMISGSTWQEINQKATAAGVNRFIPKPIFPSTLINALNECLGLALKDKLAAKKTVQNGGYHFKGYSLLLADDLQVNRDIIQILLEDTQISIDHAENGRQALELFKQNPQKYNLLLMDITMPEMDGYEAVRSIRALPCTEAKNVPIIAMTANVLSEEKEKYRQAGIDAYISKPVEVKQLFDTLAAYLKPCAAPVAADQANASYKPVHLTDTATADEDYAAFLPVIDVAAGLCRVMNNKKLYLTLLNNFPGRSLAAELITLMNESDFPQTAQKARVLKGMAANLGLTQLEKLLTTIEEQAKLELPSRTLTGELHTALETAMNFIGRLLEGEVK